MDSLATLTTVRTRTAISFGVILISGAGVAFSSYLTAVSLAVLKATCIYCLSSFAIVTVIFSVSLIARVLSHESSQEESV